MTQSVSSAVRSQALDLLDLAYLMNPEGEELDLSDIDLTPQEMAQLRSFLSTLRTCVDTVNGALARKWMNEYPGETYNDGVNRWWVGRSKRKKFVGGYEFFRWLSKRTPDQLEALVNPNNIKVGGLTAAERSTFFDESEQNDRLSIDSKPVDL